VAAMIRNTECESPHDSNANESRKREVNLSKVQTPHGTRCCVIQIYMSRPLTKSPFPVFVPLR
jgi:hypothetical protein